MKRLKQSLILLLLVMVGVCLKPMTAKADQVVTYSVTLASDVAYKGGYYIPTETGLYTFYSSDIASGDPYIYLTDDSTYNTNGIRTVLNNAGCSTTDARTYSLAYKDDISSSDRNFSITYLLFSGVKYNLYTCKYAKGVEARYQFNCNLTPKAWLTQLNKNGGSGGTDCYYTAGGRLQNVAGDTQTCTVAWSSSSSNSGFSYISCPTRSGYTFLGYYGSSSGGTQYINENGYISSMGKNLGNTILYAHWWLNTYRLYFDANGGSCSTAYKDRLFSERYGELPVPVREGYTFVGWYLSDGTAVSSYTIVNVVSNRTLFAHWVPDVYQLTFDAKGGTCSQASKVVTYDSTYGNLPTAVRSGYSFMGWYLSNDTTITSATRVKTTENQTLYAKWKQNETQKPPQTKPQQTPGTDKNAALINRFKNQTPAIQVKVTGSNSHRITWSSVSGAAQYRLYYTTSKNGKFALLKVFSGKVTSYTNSKLKSNKTYYYRVTATRTVSGKTISSKNSKVFSKKVYGAPGKPDFKDLKLSSKWLTLSWKKQSGTSGVVIYKKEGKSSYKEWKKISSKKTSYKVKMSTFSSKKVYDFKLRSYVEVDGVRLWSKYSVVHTIAY